MKQVAWLLYIPVHRVPVFYQRTKQVGALTLKATSTALWPTDDGEVVSNDALSSRAVLIAVVQSGVWWYGSIYPEAAIVDHCVPSFIVQVVDCDGVVDVHEAEVAFRRVESPLHSTVRVVWSRRVAPQNHRVSQHVIQTTVVCADKNINTAIAGLRYLGASGYNVSDADCSFTVSAVCFTVHQDTEYLDLTRTSNILFKNPFNWSNKNFITIASFECYSCFLFMNCFCWQLAM